jgi:hypothetical protein
VRVIISGRAAWRQRKPRPPARNRQLLIAKSLRLSHKYIVMNIKDLSISQLNRIIALKEQIAQIEGELAALLGAPAKAASSTSSSTRTVGRKKGGMSAEGRARIIAAQKLRWAKVKAAKGGAPAAAKPAKAKKFTMSAAAKAAISRAAKARWAKIRAGKK